MFLHLYRKKRMAKKGNEAYRNLIRHSDALFNEAPKKYKYHDVIAKIMNFKKINKSERIRLLYFINYIFWRNQKPLSIKVGNDFLVKHSALEMKVTSVPRRRS